MTRRPSEIGILLIAILLVAAGVSGAHVIKTKWVTSTSQTSSGVVGDDKNIYSVTDSGQLSAFDRLSGGIRWTVELNSRTLVTPALAGGAIYVGAENGLHVVSTAGQLQGSISLNGSVLTPPIVYEGNILVITKAGEVDVIRADGQISKSSVLRTVNLPGETEGSAAVYSGKLYVFLTDGRLMSVDPLTGAVATLYDSGRPVWRSTPAIVDGMIYVGAGRYLMGISTSGGLNLSKELDGNIYSPMYYNGVIYVGSDDGSLYALTPDGETIWRFRSSDAIRTPPLATEQSIYFTSHDKNLYSLYPNGSLSWSSLLTDWPSAPVQIGGVIYTVSYDGAITATSPIGCSISVPEGNSTVFARVSMAGEGYADGGVSRIEVRTVPGDWQTVGGLSEWSTTLPVSGFAEGQISIECRVTDSLGNVEIEPYEQHYYNYVFSEEKLPIINATYSSRANVKEPITIRFIDAEGKPLTGLAVTVSGEKYIVTDESGKFVYVPQSEGELKMFVEKPNHQTKTITITVSKPLIQPVHIILVFVLAVATVIYFSMRKGRWK